MKGSRFVALMGVLGTLALCMLPSSCETDHTPTGNIRGQSIASAPADSLASLPMTSMGLPPSARLFDTDDGALEQAIAAAHGLAFVAFKSPSSVRTFEAAGRRAAVPAATTRQALNVLASSGVEILNVYRNFAMAYVRLGAGQATVLRKNALVDFVDPLTTERPLDPPVSLMKAVSLAPRGPQHVSAQYVPWNVSFVRAPAAWPYTKGASTTIMLLGFGIAPHEDNPTVPSGNCGGWFNACSTTLWSNGTAELGIMAARDNSLGVEGVAPAIQGANVTVWRALDDSGYINWNSYYAGMDAAVSRHIRTVLVDLQHTNYVASEAANVAAEWSYGNVVVSGVGSGGQFYNSVYPPSYPNAVGVSGVRSDSTFASSPTSGCTALGTGSNYGPMVTVAAPFWATTTVNYSDGSSGYINTRSDWGWCADQLSAAHVAGIIALLQDRFPNDGAGAIVYRLTRTASQWPTKTNYLGYGIPNAGAAVLSSGPPSVYVYISGPTVITAQGSYTWSAYASGGNGSFSYQWAADWDDSFSEQLGTQSSQDVHIWQGDPNFWIIVTATSGGSTATDSIYVRDCIGGC